MLLLSEKELNQRGVRFCRQHLRRLIKAGRFPRPINIGENRVAWIATEIDAWLAERIRERDAALEAA